MSGICANATRQGSLFVGSFNINSEDLSQEDAKAWLAKAADAEVVALGLQVHFVQSLPGQNITVVEVWTVAYCGKLEKSWQ